MYISRVSGYDFLKNIVLFNFVTCTFTSSVDPDLFDLFLCVPLTIFQLNRDGSSWIEPVIS